MSALWDNYTAAQKEKFIDSFARELAEEQRSAAQAENGEPGCWHDGADAMADLIDPKKGASR
jgi:hypothetical protein